MSVPSNVVVIVVYMYLSKVPAAQLARSLRIHTLRTCLNFVHLPTMRTAGYRNGPRDNDSIPRER